MAIRLPITTTSGHVSRAIRFFEMDKIYFAIGKSSPWEGEDAPNFSAPLPSPDTKELTELIGMKLVTTKSLVYPDDEGTIVYRDQAWRKISIEDAMALGAHWVYIETSIEYDELPSVGYRQVGVCSRVQPKSGVSASKMVLLPNEIANTGILEILDQRKVIHRNEDSRDTFSMIIEF